jgi:hypothetical protein
MGPIPTLASNSKRQLRNELETRGDRFFTGFFTYLRALAEFAFCSFNARPLLAYSRSADRFTLATMSEAMKQQFGLIQRPWGVYYLKNKVTGEQTTLKTRDKNEAQRLLQAHNDTHIQPHFNLALARVYTNGADPKLGTRTWQEVMDHIVERKTSSNAVRNPGRSSRTCGQSGLAIAPPSSSNAASAWKSKASASTHTATRGPSARESAATLSASRKRRSGTTRKPCTLPIQNTPK